MSKRYAKVKENASTLFVRKARKTYRNVPLPKTYREFAETLRALSGKTLEIDREYNDRVVLLYSEPKIADNGTKIVAIDLETELVEWV